MYAYRVQAFNAGGASSYSNTASVMTAAAPTPPAAPTELTATGVSTSQINVSWTDNASNETGFRLERCAGAGCTSFTEVAAPVANVTTFQDAGLTSGSSYTYRVQAYNTGGNSGYSRSATAVTSTGTGPAAPANLVATAVSSTQINLSWSDMSSNEAGFRIESCSGLNCTNFSELAVVGTNVTSFQNTGLSSNSRYQYRVRAYSGSGVSGYSNVAPAGTLWPAAVLQAPGVSGTSVTLTWTFQWPPLSATGEGYRVEQSTTSPTSGFAEIAQLATRTSPYILTLTRTAGTYYFRVRVYLNQGGATYSEYSQVQSAIVSAAPPAAPSNLAATPASGSQVSLTWSDNSTNENGFRIERCTGSACTGFLQIATTGPNVAVYQDVNLSASTAYRYRVLAQNAAGASTYSNVATVTTLGATSTRFQNNASYPIIYLTIDGVQQFPQSPLGILPGYYYEITLGAGTHTYEARTGFWDGSSRFEMYVYRNTFTQQSGVTGTVTIPDITIFQLLTQFGSSGYWSGDYWVGTTYHFAAFRFYSNGTFKLYDDGVQVGSGSYSLVSRSPSTLTVTFSVGANQGTLDELGGYFNMRNGPPDWPWIQYTYRGQ